MIESPTGGWVSYPDHVKSIREATPKKTVSNKQDILDLVDAYKVRNGATDADICRRSGIVLTTLNNLRKEPRRSVSLRTAVALQHAIDLETFVLPTHQETDND